MTAPAQLNLVICRPPRIVAGPLIISARAACYACDARAIGTRDRRPEGGRVEAACIRHAETFNGTGGAQ